MQKFRLAGINYANRDGKSRGDILRKSSPGASVILERDPANQYDRNAIVVLTQNGEDIGFVPKTLAAELAPLMDAGEGMSGVLHGDEVSLIETDIPLANNHWYQLVLTLLESGMVFDQTVKQCKDEKYSFFMDLELLSSQERVLLFAPDEKKGLHTCSIMLSKERKLLITLGDNFDKKYWLLGFQEFQKNTKTILDGIRNYLIHGEDFLFGLELSQVKHHEVRVFGGKEFEGFEAYINYLYHQQKADFNWVLNRPGEYSSDLFPKTDLYVDMDWMVQPQNGAEIFFHEFLTEDLYIEGNEITPAEKIAATLISFRMIEQAFKESFQISPELYYEFIHDYTPVRHLDSSHIERFPRQKMRCRSIALAAWIFSNRLPDVDPEGCEVLFLTSVDYYSRLFSCLYPKVYEAIWPFEKNLQHKELPMGWFGSKTSNVDYKVEHVFKKCLEFNIAQAGSPDMFKKNVRATLDKKLERANGNKDQYCHSLLENVGFFVLGSENYVGIIQFVVNSGRAISEEQFWGTVETIQQNIREKMPEQVETRFSRSYGKIQNLDQRIDQLEFDYLYNFSSSQMILLAAKEIVTDPEMVKALHGKGLNESLQLIMHHHIHYLNYRIDNRVAAMGKAS